MPATRPKQLTALFIAIALVVAPLVGCESLPGNEKQQGAVIGGVGGALAGAAIAKDNRLVGALIGGVLGAGGGYLIGAQVEKNNDKHKDEALKANERAQSNPARPEDARRATTADINNDGFVTLDEVVAMQAAGLGSQEQIRRLQATGQVFELTQSQEDYLRDKGVDRDVIVAMRTLNQDRDGVRASDRISHD